jgi:hypothetical protein
MSFNQNQKASKRNGNGSMNRTKDWRSEITIIAGPMLPTDTMGSWFFKAVKRSGAKLRQIEDLYHGRCVDPKYSLAEKILTAADLARIEQAKKAKHELASILANAANALERIDPDFHRETIDQYRAGSREIGTENSA